MSVLTPILTKLATSKVEVVGDGSEAHQVKDLETLFLERGFIALTEVMPQGGKYTCQAGCCDSCCFNSCSSCWGPGYSLPLL